MEKLLVHICCGVDAVYALRKLKEEFPETHIEGYFYDPNIHPEEEYLLRWIETERVCNQLGIRCHLAPYELDNWLKAVKGLENEPERGERCTVCHDLRLEKTAQFAKKHGFDSITTVLMMSPKKDFGVLKAVGNSVAGRYDLQFVAVDFRKKGGVEKMNKLSKEAQLYHQNYCGCMYALFQQRQDNYIKELVSFGKGRLPGSREELLFIKEIRKFAESLGIQCEEQPFSFANWRVLRSVLKINKKPVPHNVLWFSRSVKGILRARPERVLEQKGFYQVFLNKQNAQLWVLKGKLREIPLEVTRPFTDSIFIISINDLDADIADIKVEAQLETEFDENGRSQNLFIGSKTAEKRLEFHSDTLTDGTGGYTASQIKAVIEEQKDKILAGKLCVAVYGCKTAGNLGRQYEEQTYPEYLINI
ncbi:epoxyqueuosine reductase QueH [Persephonella sp.]